MYLRKKFDLKSIVFSKIHDQPTVGHLGFTKTYEWVKHSFFLEGMKHEIHTFVDECDTCQ
jgi:hypothetical protein